MIKSEIAYLNRDELIDFISKNWNNVTKHLPQEKKKSFFESSPTCELREIALNLATD